MKDWWAKRGTVREQIKALHKKGHTYFEIAEQLNIALSTVGYHLSERYRQQKLKYGKERYKMFKQAVAELNRIKVKN